MFPSKIVTVVQKIVTSKKIGVTDVEKECPHCGSMIEFPFVGYDAPAVANCGKCGNSVQVEMTAVGRISK